MNRSFILVAILISIVGCAARYNVDTDSILFSEPKAKAYIMKSMINGISADHPRFQEYSRYVEKALEYHGYVRVSDENKADIAVMMYYGMGSPEVYRHTFTEPVYGFIDRDEIRYDVTTDKPTGTEITSGKIYMMPKFGIIGSEVKTLNINYYLKTIILDAYDLRTFRNTGKSIRLWETTITSKGPEDTLREVFPYIIAGALRSISTNETHKSSISASDEAVDYIKGLGAMPDR